MGRSIDRWVAGRVVDRRAAQADLADFALSMNDYRPNVPRGTGLVLMERENSAAVLDLAPKALRVPMIGLVAHPVDRAVAR